MRDLIAFWAITFNIILQEFDTSQCVIIGHSANRAGRAP